MKRTYQDNSVLIQAVQGVDGEKTVALLDDQEREPESGNGRRATVGRLSATIRREEALKSEGRLDEQEAAERAEVR
jgi:hypothetical protein